MKKLAVLALFLMLSVELIGQNHKFTKYFISPQAGVFGALNAHDGFFYGTDITVEIDSLIYSLSYSKLTEFNLLGPVPSEYYHLLGVMMGKRAGDKAQIHGQAGLASMWGIRRTRLLNSGFLIDEYASEEFFTIGLQLKTGFRVIVGNHFGFGLDLQANLSPKLISSMWGLSIEIGKLRGDQ